MPSQSRIQQVELLREKLQEAEAVFVCEYRGLNVSRITALRAAIRGAGGEMNVAKNTLMEIALHQESMPVPESVMTGPNAFTIAKGDAAAGPCDQGSHPGRSHPLGGPGQGTGRSAFEGGPAGTACRNDDRPRQRSGNGAFRHHSRTRDMSFKNKGAEGRKGSLKTISNPNGCK